VTSRRNYGTGVTLPWPAGWLTPEVCAALAAADRDHDLTEHELNTAGQTWGEYWAAIRAVELTTAAEQHAGQLARSHALRGADGVHLASALAIGDYGLVMAVWDRRLHWGARSAGLRVAPAALDPQMVVPAS
jgi:uncharacterized protein